MGLQMSLISRFLLDACRWLQYHCGHSYLHCFRWTARRMMWMLHMESRRCRIDWIQMRWQSVHIDATHAVRTGFQIGLLTVRETRTCKRLVMIIWNKQKKSKNSTKWHSMEDCNRVRELQNEMSSPCIHILIHNSLIHNCHCAEHIAAQHSTNG